MNRILWAACVIAIVSAGPAGADEYVYLAQAPGECTLPTGPASLEYSLYVHSGDYSDVRGVTLRVECDRFGPADVSSVTPAPGVTIVGGDIFNGIELSFSPRALAHDPILTIHLSSQVSDGDAWTRNVTLLRAAGAVPVPDFVSLGWVFDCYGTFVIWDAPDTVSVTVDKDDGFQFDAIVTTGSYPPNATVTVLDPAGWVSAAVNEDVYAGCGWCQWNVTTVAVPTRVPAAVAEGTLNEITLRMSSFGGLVGERKVVLRAVGPVAVQHKTLGGVKAIYR
jgi:hypothetical protein